MAPSYSRGRHETSRTGPNAPPELAQPDFACSASDETKKLEPTFGLHCEMDESRRLKVMYRTASPRELVEFQLFPRRCQRVEKMGVAARTVVKIIKKTPATTAGGGQAQPASGSEGEGRHGSTSVLPALSGERSERKPRRNIRYEHPRVERHHRGRDSRDRHPRDRPSTGPRWEEKNGSSVLALSPLARTRTWQSQM